MMKLSLTAGLKKAMFKSMIYKTIVFLFTLMLSGFYSENLFAQEKLWIKLEKGLALVLNPTTSEWIPLSAKDQIPAKTVLLTKPDSKLLVFRETTVSETPANGYFFAEDLFPKTRNELVSALVRIETSQLPAGTQPGTDKPVVGLTYGKEKEPGSQNPEIPFLSERLNAVSWFTKQKKYDSALLSIKRILIKYPDLYKNPDLVNGLLELYEKLELYGYLYDESSRLMTKKTAASFDQMVLKWNDLAKKKLTGRGEQ